MAQVIQIGKRRWVAGLAWRTFEDVPSKLEIADDAESLNAQWVCVRVGQSAVQAGFCEHVEGVSPGERAYSLAAMLADSKKQPWLGIFRVSEDLWWYVAVRDGHAVLPDGDVIGGEQEILAARERHSGYGDWEYYEGDLTLLSDFIADVDSKPSRIRPVNPTQWLSQPGALLRLFRGLAGPRFAITVGLSISVIAALYAGFVYYKKIEDAERASAMAAMRAQMQANQPAVVAQASAIRSAPDPQKWLLACARIINNVPLSFYGWVPTNPGCSASQVSSQLSSQVSIHWVRADGATVALRPEGVVAADGETIDQTVALEGVEPSGTDNGADIASEKLALRAWAQRVGFTLNFAQESPAVTQATLPGSPGVLVATSGMCGTGSTGISAPGMPTAAQVAFSLDMLLSPFGMDFSALPGLRLTGIQRSEAGWRVTGVLFARSPA